MIQRHPVVPAFVLAATTVAICFMNAPGAIGSAQGYCLGGDTCPTAGSSLEVFSICADSGAGPTCSSSLDLSTVDDVVLGRVTIYGLPTITPLAACVKTGSTWKLHRLKYSSYRGGGKIGLTGQVTDMALCGSTSADQLRVRYWTGPGCDGYAFSPWNYGTSNYWLELWGRGGNDNLQGAGGHDKLCGGTGSEGDAAYAEVGLFGRGMADDLDGWTGDDVADGYTGGDDEVWGYGGNDHVLDLVYEGAGYVNGEDDDDDCVYIDEGSPSASEVVCGSGDDDTTPHSSSGSTECENHNTFCWSD